MEKYFDAVESKDIRELIYRSVENYGDNTAYVVKKIVNKKEEYTNYSYKQTLEIVNAVGTKFFEMGLSGKRVALIGRNRFEWIATHFAALCGGMVSVPLDKELQIGELTNCLVRSKADVVMFDEKYIDAIKEIRANGEFAGAQYFCMGELKKEEDIAEYKTFWQLVEEGKALLASGRRDYLDVQIDPYKMAILLFTSGTTSMSKAVMLSQNNVASNVYAMQLVEPLYPTDTNLAFLPFHHVFGSAAFLVMFACGIRTAFPDGLRYVAKNLKEYEVSVFVGVPLLIEAIYKNIEIGVEKKGKTGMVKFAKGLSKFLLFFGIDIRRKLFKDIINELGGKMRFMISGGAPLNKRVAEGLTALGIEVAQGYGLTETAPVVAAENYKKKRAGSIGVPMGNVEVAFDDIDENGIGELKVKGPNVMLGYYENDEATNAVMENGWFHTGDLGYKDKDGYIFITGRKKDMIVLKNGKKVFPEEVEALINDIPEVSESMVYGLLEDDGNVKLCAKVVYDKNVCGALFEGGKIDEDKLRAQIWEKIKLVNKTFPTYKYVKGLTLTSVELIKTTTKKIKRNEEMKLILGGGGK